MNKNLVYNLFILSIDIHKDLVYNITITGGEIKNLNQRQQTYW